MHPNPIHFLSLGAGVQSSTLRFMDEMDDPQLRALFPRSAGAITADTKHEPKEVYAWLKFLIEATPRTPIHIVTAGDLVADSLTIRTSKKTGNIYGRPLIPAYVAKDSGGRGILGRRCTAEYKVRVIIKKLRALLGKAAMKAWRQRHAEDLRVWGKYNAAAKAARKAKGAKPLFPFAEWHRMQSDPLAVQWIGISTDEADRMKASREPWVLTRHPLIEMGMSRIDCLAWMASKSLPEPPKSACKFCPFHSDEMWLDQKVNQPEEFAESVKFEKDLNAVLHQQTGTAKLDGQVFFHDSLRPLGEIDFAKLVREQRRPGHTQLGLFANECEGMCGV